MTVSIITILESITTKVFLTWLDDVALFADIDTIQELSDILVFDGASMADRSSYT